MGDGELAEGSNWEAAAAAGHHKLENLVVIVDRNGLQISGPTVEVMTYEPLEERWQAFGWAVRRIDGHDFGAILKTLGDGPFERGKPSAIVADTVKSQGAAFRRGQGGVPLLEAAGRGAGAGRAGPGGRSKGRWRMKRGEMKDPRKTFGEAVLAQAESRPRIVVLSADSSSGSGLSPFKKRFPERHLEFGIMEQGVIGFASGLATTGKVPFVAAIAPFVTSRPFEMVRNDVGYMRQNVKVVGRSGGAHLLATWVPPTSPSTTPPCCAPSRAWWSCPRGTPSSWSRR